MSNLNSVSNGFRRLVNLASLIAQNRVFAVLLAAYVSLFGRIAEEAYKLRPPAAQWDATGVDFLDLGKTEPLTRASVLSHSRQVPSASTTGGKRGKAVMRQQLTEEEVLNAQDQLANETEFEILEQALHIANTAKNPAARSELMSGVYGSLGSLYSAQGKYHQALHAMDLALKAASESQESESVALGHIALGQLELRHHRYYAAGTRFEDALNLSDELANETHAAALAGYGWATLMSGRHDAAKEYFLGALRSSGVPLLPPGAEGQATITASAPAPEACRPHHDTLDADRIVALVGLGLLSDLESLSACAEAISSEVSADAIDSRAWSALGLAQHALGRTDAARRHHRRALQLLPGSGNIKDLPAISHGELHLGLVEFGAGSQAKGMDHVERLLKTADQVVPLKEVAEWLTRFARAHIWAPAGCDFASELFGRAGALLHRENVGADALAKHFVDQGLFLYRLEPSRVPQAIVQFRRAREVLESSEHRWPLAEVAGLHNLLGAAHHRVGEVEEAIESYDRALQLDLLVAAGTPSQEQQVQLMVSYGNLAALRLLLAGRDRRQWRALLDDFRKGRSAARKSGLSKNDPQLQNFEASFQNAMRLAQRNGMLETCPGPVEMLMRGPVCTSDIDDAQ
eukprot:gnl/TRDRNA2_/TRDRNA2_117094_c0_seq1.p1 gnl/TRDRNA2_/TRDRNA2_117094_c0~~gnl/TRDRNA2_/TRDRNA2_117094_c0_seq1.p1  ORF type:complete len:632 (+),score=110.45 gnl/TRDRNA2_/TRDRNA2_117094_c0_seq1:118-2013(+)